MSFRLASTDLHYIIFYMTKAIMQIYHIQVQLRELFDLLEFSFFLELSWNFRSGDCCIPAIDGNYVTKIEILDLKVIFLATSLFIVDDVRNVRPILSSVHPVMLATILEIGVRRLLSSISVINIDVADFIIYFMRTYDSY